MVHVHEHEACALHCATIAECFFMFNQYILVVSQYGSQHEIWNKYSCILYVNTIYLVRMK